MRWGRERRASRGARRPARITVVSPYFEPEHSGSAPYVTQVARHLAGEYTVTLLTGVPHYPEWRIADGYGAWRTVEREPGGLEVRRLRHYVPAQQSALTRGWYELSFALRVLREGLFRRADVVLAFTPPVLSTAAAGLLARLHRASFGIVVHDLAGLGARETGIKGGAKVAGLVGQVERRTLAAADGIVVLHPAFVRHVAARDDDERVRVIRNWARPLSPAHPREETRRRLGWSETACVVLHSGNMGMKQGLENVVEAARLATERGADVQFVLMGDGSRREELEQLGAGIDRLTFLPPAPTEEFADVLAAADVLLVNERPGVSEMSVPSKLTAYFSAGRPVLTASAEASPSSTEVQAAHAGDRVEPGDPTALLEAVQALHADPARSGEAGSAGRRFAEDEFDAGRALDRYTTWVRDLQ